MADYDLQYQDTHIDALLATANELKTAGYIYKGVATPSTNPGTPTERVAYLASEPGTYTNFGGIVIASGLYSLTYASGTWTGTQMSAGSDIEVVQTTGDSTTDVMSQKAVTDKFNNLSENLEDEVTDEIMTTPQSWDLSYGGDFTWELGTIHDDGKAYSSSSYYHLYIPVSDIKGWKVKMKAQPTNTATYALLKNIGFAYPSSPLNISMYYCEGYSTTVVIPAGQEATFVIPNDCNYIYISCGQISGVVALPQSNSYYTHKWGDVVQTTGDNTQAVMSQKAVTDEIETQIPLMLENYLTSTPDNGGKWLINNNYHHYQTPINPNDVLRVQAQTNTYTRIWFCTQRATPTANQYIPMCSGETGRHNILAGTTETFIAPADAHYVYVDGVQHPKGIWIIKSIKDAYDNNLEGGNVKISYNSAQAVNAHTGKLATISGYGHSNYTLIAGAKKISVYCPNMGSGVYGIAFYKRMSDSTYISGQTFSVDGVGNTWMTFDVPDEGNYFRMTMTENTDAEYRIVVPTDYLVNVFEQSAESMIATQILRSAVPISDKEYIYAFGISQQIIIGSKAYVLYGANEHTVDGDAVGYPNVSCMTVVDLFDLSKETVLLTTGTKQYADGSSASNATIGYTTYCPTPNDDIAKFGLMRFNNNNPYYCWSINAVNETVNNWTGCQLSYNNAIVDFSINNYRQMLVDMGYMSTYIAGSKNDYVDNINIHYNNEENIYYAVLCGAAATNSQNLPLVLMQSADLATWSPKAYLGLTIDAGEIAAIYKNGIAYVVYRRMSAGMGYIVYDVNNSTILSSGNFPTSGQLLSKPDCFIFDDRVYMAVNVDPSVYGGIGYPKQYMTDARQEIIIYKIVNDVPKFFKRVCNPTGLQYFSFMETPPMYAESSSAGPMDAQGAIYLAFSEDRRHLYRRQIAQVSFADVTALFADSGRIG